ncbi:inner membrane CreD family protein [Novosphingobium colocasiae]
MTEPTPRRERSPGMKLLFVGLVSLVLIAPLMLVYALVYDRQEQSATAQAAINAGWGGPQVISGPVLVVPFRTTQTQNETVDGKQVSRVVEVEKNLYISPVSNRATTRIDPQERRKSIYRSVLFVAQTKGKARFALPGDLARFGVTRERLLWDRAELRMGASDAGGLTTGGRLLANGRPLEVQPGKGPASSGGQGFFAFLAWDGLGALDVDYGFELRGSRTISLVPRGGSTEWDVRSAWPSPSFDGSFLPEKNRKCRTRASPRITRWTSSRSASRRWRRRISACPSRRGTATAWRKLLRQARWTLPLAARTKLSGGPSHSLNISLIEPVNLYSKVDRSVKYGFLFIGFTFLAFFSCSTWSAGRGWRRWNTC